MRSQRNSTDGDFLAPYSAIVIISGGALVGALLGFTVGSVVQTATASR